MKTLYTYNNKKTYEPDSLKSCMPVWSATLLTIFLAFLMGNSSTAQVKIPGNMNIGLVYPLSSNGRFAVLDTNYLSVNLIAGLSSVEKGPAIAGFSNIIRNESFGPAIAGFSNHIGDKAYGPLFAGFINTYGDGGNFAFAGFSNASHGNVRGGQFAGFSNYARGVSGAQIAGFLNRAEDVTGSQVTGFMNVAIRNVSASQLAGFMNTAKDVSGSQLAGFMNTGKEVKGSQLAGFMNTAKDVKGSQISGFMNVARKVKGAQIAGFMNVADSSDYPIGFINMIKNGEKSVGASIDEDQTVMASFRSGGKVLYGIVGVGYNFKNEDEIYAAELGFGAHMIRSRVFNLNAEISESVLESFKKGEYFKSAFALMPAVKLTPHLEIFGGPSFNYINTNTKEGQTLHGHYLRTWAKSSGGDFQAIYVSYTAGIAVPF